VIVLRILAGVVIGLALLLVLSWPWRRSVVVELVALGAGGSVALLDPIDEPRPVEWFDDYYTVELIDTFTVAIGEPRYPQQNYNYLILGESRAVLFDSGPGVREIRPVVDMLTQLPVMHVPSHLHYDHLGNAGRFERLGVVDLPYLRARAEDGVLRPTRGEHLGFIEGLPIPRLRVTDWLPVDGEIDLGGRRLRVLHTPGHTRDSISLLDEQRRQLFTGDYIHQGSMFVFLPGSSLGDLLRTADALVERLPEDVVLLTAHRYMPPGAPLLSFRHLAAMREALHEIRSGTRPGDGFFPRSYRVTNDLSLLTDVPWGQDWE
jgi:hydroxyacylglutathione hydrolase